MSLKTSISLSSSYDWKAIYLTDTSGSGITGYGTSQQPVGYREIANITDGTIIITDRDGNTWTLTKSGSAMRTIAASGLTVSPYNIGLDNLPDTQFYDSIFSFLYLPWFQNDPLTEIVTTLNNKTVTYIGDNYNFENVTHIRDISGTVYQISSINKTTKTITLVTAWTGTAGTLLGDEFFVGIATTSYIAISQAIKTCLDNRIVDMSTGNCKCQATDVMHQALMYDAMNLNLAQANQTRGYQMYDWLTTKCEQDCGCY